MSHVLTLEIADEVYEPLVEKAKAIGQSVETVAGACLAESAARLTPGSRLRQLAGFWASHVPDAGVGHDEYLGQALYDELNEPSHD